MELNLRYSMCLHGVKMENAAYDIRKKKITQFDSTADQVNPITLEPENIKSINLGAIWSFSKVTGLP
jgi:hypothetical protein